VRELLVVVAQLAAWFVKSQSHPHIMSEKRGTTWKTFHPGGES